MTAPKIDGFQVFRGTRHHHIDQPYKGWYRDMATVIKAVTAEVLHECIWRRNAKTPIDEAKRLAGAGLIVLEDSPNGPMITRTWRGTRALIQHMKGEIDG